MQPIQRSEAIDLLLTITEVSEDIIDGYKDYVVEAWLGELGYEWDPNAGVVGAWVPMREPPPVFGSIQITDTGSDFGPLFAGQQQEAQP